MSARCISHPERTAQATGADDAELQALVLELSLIGLSVEIRWAVGNTNRISLYTVCV
jgi:hypothetical protein